MSEPDEPGAGVRWMTYRELATALAVSLPAAEARVRRGRWVKRPGNDGTIRVAVPAEVLEPTPSPAQNPMSEGVIAALAALTAAHDAALGELRRRAEAAEQKVAETGAALAVAENGEREAIARLVETVEARRAEAAELGSLRETAARLAADLEEARAPWWRRVFTRLG